MTATFARHKRKRKLKAEINVVPYIDVMLVLLIIFMVTAPLLNLGVDIDLPKSNARSVETKKDPIMVSVDANGGYTLKLPDSGKERVSAAELQAKVKAIVSSNPDVAVFIAGDRQASYDKVYDAMALLQIAGVNKVGLMSKPTEGN
ncbi:MAG TPA: protein TolR [Arenimonas sp.]|uniref:protein TolR n=1 Tax=Arenimonas sp. TaxID=1872635 RepID=UPI002C32E84D|nr:protein TolR [Arenimonas sp.]HMB58144.1 protein TolR [Arenimonas sp.]